MPPWTHRVQADDEEVIVAIDRLGRLPVPLELTERVRQPGRERPGDVMVAWNDYKRPSETLEERGGAVVLLGSAAVGQIAACDDQRGVDAVYQSAQRGLDPRLLDGADMEVRQVEEPCGHRRRRLVH